MYERNSLNKELSTLGMYLEKIKNYTIKKRIIHLLDWYIRKATFYKNLYYFLSVIIIAINALIPVIIQIKFHYYNNVTSIISALASVFTSVITLFTMKDTWHRYRKSAELIKKECMLFSINFGEYEKEANKEELLLSNIEMIISNERDDWELKFVKDKK
ncbi:MAG TPA: hypothetical protein DG753_05705 [Clostridium sp.]|nr:hypothetical protein [Clostridium sp.]